MAVLISGISSWKKDNQEKRHRISLIVFIFSDALLDLYDSVLIEEPHIALSETHDNQFVDYTYVENEFVYVNFVKAICDAYEYTYKNKQFIEKAVNTYNGIFNNILDTVHRLSENPQFRVNLKKYLIEENG